MIIGIKGIGIYRPNKSIRNFDRAISFDISDSFIRSKIGMSQLTRINDNQETTDLGKNAVESLCNKTNIQIDQVECLILVTQNPDKGGLPHSSSILHKKLGMSPACSVFDISLGCTGYVHGLSIIKSYMEGHKLKNGLLVTSDPYSKIIDNKDKDTSLLFGDGATATWIGESPKWSIDHFDFGVDSQLHDALEINSNGKLSMNGRAVFNFAATQVPPSIKRVLHKAGLEMDQIDLVILHQGSKYIIDTLAKRLGTVGKTPFGAQEYGNTISSSIPMLITEHVPDNAKRVILSGFGVGLAWATCLMEKNND